MASNQNQKSRISLFGAVAAASISIGGAVALIEAYSQKRQLEEKFSSNNEECDECFVNVEDLEAKEGDLIEIQRDSYAHWVVYVGNGFVIHITQIGRGLSKVFREKLKNVAKTSVCRVNNLVKASRRLRLTPMEVNTIISTAYENLGKVFEYHLFNNNCEHFATYCRFGKPFSEQGVAANQLPIIRSVAPFFAASKYQYD